MKNKNILILIVALLLGFFVITQSKSFEKVSQLLSRENQSNAFQEIKILKDKNESLEKEIDNLTVLLGQTMDQNKALAAIDQEISTYEKLSGNSPIYGPGLVITIDGVIDAQALIDLTNELFGFGASAISVNGIRLTNRTAGFEALPQGQILLNGSILSSPYVITAIGESSTISSMLEIPGGIFTRLSSSFPKIFIKSTAKEIIQMN